MTIGLLAVWLTALVLDRWWGELRRGHPLVFFGRYAGWLEQRLNASASRSSSALLLLGALAMLLALLPWIFFVWWLGEQMGVLVWLFDSLVLYFALGRRSLFEHAMAVRDPLFKGELAEARHATARIVSRETATASEQDLVKAVVETSLENSNDAVFASLFWYALAGSPGVVLHRLANTLDAMWGYRNERFLYFGRSAARLDDLLAFVPAQLLSLLFCLVAEPGSRLAAFRAWWQQGRHWKSINAGSVMASGAAALGLSVGGAARYAEGTEERPRLGCGRSPQPGDIEVCFRLQRRAIALAVVILAVLIVLAGPRQW
ncbi:cobalamin biosynthesis protein [Litorivivens sp.]|uniref:cobalamin biosynthesis protein CobD/CbiB n=1 Tax=Litorivivens sp. TaxID=2020868 RepID=UPI003563ABD8